VNTENCSFTDCDIYDNSIGLTIEGGGNHRITFNSIYSNSILGLQILNDSSGCSIWGNDFYSNGINAFDNTGNVWDDGTFLGNSYDNYTGPGFYDIPGNGGGIDHYPINYYNYTGPIQIFLPPSLNYYEDTIGNELQFYILSETRYDFEVVEGGIGRGGGGNHDWPYQHFNIDGYDFGVYLFEVTAEDRLSNIATANVTLNVTIDDETLPVIQSTSQVTEFEGSSNNLNWVLYDEHPWRFSVEVNGSPYLDGDWNYDGETIGLSIMAWEPGVYNISFTAIDIVQNTAKFDTLLVILPLITISEPDDLFYIVGTTGNYLEWDVLEGEPDRFELYRNGSLHSEGLIEHSIIHCNIDNLDLGFYNFTVLVFEGSYYILDTVYVHVVSEDDIITITATIIVTNSTVTSNLSITINNTLTGVFVVSVEFMIIVAASGSIIIIFVIAVIVLKRPETPSTSYI